MLSSQETFTKVRDHLLTQKKKSGSFRDDGSFRCLYRGPDGLKCAIGILLKDDDVVENISADNIPSCKLNTEMPARQLQELQSIHDFDSVDNWAKALDKFARRFGYVTESE